MFRIHQIIGDPYRSIGSVQQTITCFMFVNNNVGILLIHLPAVSRSRRAVVGD